MTRGIPVEEVLKDNVQARVIFRFEFKRRFLARLFEKRLARTEGPDRAIWRSKNAEDVFFVYYEHPKVFKATILSELKRLKKEVRKCKGKWVGVSVDR